MNFIKGKAGLLLLLLSVMFILAVVWFCLFDMHIYAEPHGTFVEQKKAPGRWQPDGTDRIYKPESDYAGTQKRRIFS